MPGKGGNPDCVRQCLFSTSFILECHLTLEMVSETNKVILKWMATDDEGSQRFPFDPIPIPLLDTETHHKEGHSKMYSHQ